jgi:predicted alpha-1,2-mannosidase
MKTGTIQAVVLLIAAVSLSPACGGRSERADGGSTDASADASVDAGLFDPVPYVNPMIATGGSGFWGAGSGLPGAVAPSGLVKPSPDTAEEPPSKYAFQLHCSGYNYNERFITGFSQVHFYGTGVPDYAVLGLMPVNGYDPTGITVDKYRSTYKKETETAAPGYYAVTLDTGIKAEITASERAALHRYTFPEDGQEHCLLLNLGHTIPMTVILGSKFALDKQTGEFGATIQTFGGLTINFGGYTIHFKGRISPLPVKTGTWDSAHVFTEGRTNCAGEKGCGMMACFGQAPVVEVSIGVSYVSQANAKTGLDAEAGSKSFDQVRAETREKWRSLLSRFEVKGGDAEKMTVFYTSLYHAFMMPTIQSDVDGSYFGFDKAVHKAHWGNYYSDFSLWDTYRTQHPFFTYFYRKEQRDMAMSLLSAAGQGGYFPKWSAANGETNCMVGTPADFVMADTYLKGIDIPASETFDLLMKTALHPTASGSGYVGREGVEDYLSLGWLPRERYAGSVAKTQEITYADEALCNMAKGLGRAEADILCRNRYNHRNLWSPTHLFFLPRKRDGTFPWEATFDPEKVPSDCFAPENSDYVEGNPWQYRWFAPHDAAWLIEQLGGREKFTAELVSFFEKSVAAEKSYVRGTDEWGSSRKYYWQGNEPNIHTPYLFSAAGRADLTCKYVRWIMDTYYLNAPDGLPGNDDAGTMSAWYLFSALGFYPIAGTDVYYVGCPLFPEVTAKLEGGTFRVTAEGPLESGAVPERIFWNGAELSKPELSWEMIKNGGELRFVMKK